MRLAKSVELGRSGMETARKKELLEDKLLGNVPEGVYERKIRECREEEMRVSAALEAASVPPAAASTVSARRI
jgi:hypothetical protein